jgi:acyl-CoA thioesterase
MNIELDVEAMMQFYEKVNLYGIDQKMTMTFVKPGEVTYEMQIEERHLSSPNTCHGGVIAGFMDSVIGTSALSLAFVDKNLVSTVEFKINYLKPVKLGETIWGKGTIEFQGKSIIVCSGEIRNKDNHKLVAKGLGTFNVYPLEKSQLKSTFNV